MPTSSYWVSFWGFKTAVWQLRLDPTNPPSRPHLRAEQHWPRLRRGVLIAVCGPCQLCHGLANYLPLLGLFLGLQNCRLRRPSRSRGFACLRGPLACRASSPARGLVWPPSTKGGRQHQGGGPLYVWFSKLFSDCSETTGTHKHCDARMKPDPSQLLNARNGNKQLTGSVPMHIARSQPREIIQTGSRRRLASISSTIL